MMVLMSVGLWLLIFSIVRGRTGVAWGVRGGGDSGGDSPPPPKSSAEIAAEQTQAMIASYPQAAQAQWNVLTSPTYGLQAQTQLQEDVRNQVFPNETAVREQLVQNILQQLMSPTGLTAEQQAAVDTSRGQATSNLQRAQRERANLGGNLFGGRAQAAEQKDVGNLQNAFATEDINMAERNRLNNSQLAMSILQMLYPNSGIVQPNFVNPVPGADTAMNANVNYTNMLNQQSMQDSANQSALMSSLFQGLGTAAGGFLGNQNFMA